MDLPGISREALEDRLQEAKRTYKLNLGCATSNTQTHSLPRCSCLPASYVVCDQHAALVVPCAL